MNSLAFIRLLGFLTLFSTLVGCTDSNPGEVSGKISFDQGKLEELTPSEGVPYLEITLQEDITQAEAETGKTPNVIAKTSIKSPKSPVSFNFNYDPEKIDENKDYVVEATIYGTGGMLFRLHTVYNVITDGTPPRNLNLELIVH